MEKDGEGGRVGEQTALDVIHVGLIFLGDCNYRLVGSFSIHFQGMFENLFLLVLVVVVA
jgi:hypothetical protein